MLDGFHELLFKPVKNRAPRRLTNNEIAQYNRLGFIQPFDIFDEGEIAEIRDFVDQVMEDMGENGAYGINCYQSRLSGIWDIATEPRILDLVSDIAGPNVICWASHILSKRPYDPRPVPWHQDAAYWRLSPARTVTVWLAIDDADAENSAMRFIPGTHDKGALKVRSASKDSVLGVETVDADSLGRPFTNVLKAGQISLHADMLVHGSLPNTSDRRRCGLTLRYCPPEVEFTDEKWAQGVEAIIARGTDPTGRWRHHARPDNNDITATSSPLTMANN